MEDLEDYEHEEYPSKHHSELSVNKHRKVRINRKFTNAHQVFDEMLLLPFSNTQRQKP